MTQSLLMRNDCSISLVTAYVKRASFIILTGTFFWGASVYSPNVSFGQPPASLAQKTRPLTAADEKNLDAIGVRENLGKSLPKNLSFRDQNGKKVELQDYFDGKRPVLLTFAYYTCPMLCGMLLRAVASGTKEVDWTMGEQYRALTVSIDSEDTPQLARAKQKEMLAAYGREVAGEGWSFLSGKPEAIEALAKTAGFRYAYDPKQGQYAHTAVAILLTPDGKISRYLYGLRFETNALRMALLEATEGKFISTTEQLILYCYRYDTKSGKYVVLATRVMQIGGAITAMILGFSLLWLLRREKQRRNRTVPDASQYLT